MILLRGLQLHGYDGLNQQVVFIPKNMFTIPSNTISSDNNSHDYNPNAKTWSYRVARILATEPHQKASTPSLTTAALRTHLPEPPYN